MKLIKQEKNELFEDFWIRVTHEEIRLQKKGFKVIDYSFIIQEKESVFTAIIIYKREKRRKK